MSQGSSHKNIIRSTALFAFVQIINVLSKIVLNKVVAILLGTSGVGIISIFNSLQSIIKTIAGLGISQSAVRDISFAYMQDKACLSQIIVVTNRLLLWCALASIVITSILSPFLSYLAFDNYAYTLPIIFLSFSVFFVILSEGKQAMIKGVRQLRNLAKCSLIGTAIGIVISIPLYYLLGMDGIVPSLITLSCAMFVSTLYFEKKIEVEPCRITNGEIMTQGRSMVKMGVALIYISIMSLVVEFGIKSFIIRIGGLDQVGLFQAGSTIVISYFGIITTSLTTDYYPRISAVYNNNKLLNKELNTQVDISLLIMGPMIVFVIAFAPFFITLLYTNAFIPALNYVILAAASTMFNIVSNMMSMIIIAKQEAKLFMLISTIFNILFLILNIIGYSLGGLFGLGVTSIINATINAVLINLILKMKYNIVLPKSSLNILVLIFIIAILCGVLNLININKMIVYVINGFVFFGLFIFSLWKFKKITNQMTILAAIRNIFNK